LCDNQGVSKQPLIRVAAFDHVTIVCADLDASRRFYVDFLGMLEVPRPAFGFAGLWFQVGNTQIHATQSSPEAGQAGWGERGNSVISRGHHFAFAVDDVSEAREFALEHGVRIASPVQQRPDGYKQLYLYDPDGHLVELVSPPARLVSDGDRGAGPSGVARR
jgi:catechol 2,3-dioxygenase-like lactoylglutathione lyase family enzyme